MSRIGRKLLRGVPRRSFQYQFSVVDQVEPNAFALPGGYIFISRGLLALANNEDELACVIGHEITHAALRHSARQQALAAAGKPLAMPWVRAANIASYGRDMEREADKGGQMLAAAAGYDPMGMSTFLRNMGQNERLIVGHSRLPTFYDTHPGSTERASTNAIRAREIRWKRDPALGDTRASLLREIDGLALGPRPEAASSRATVSSIPISTSRCVSPTAGAPRTPTAAVGAVSPRGDAVVFLMADLPAGDPQTVADAFVEKTQQEQSVDVKESQPVKIGRIDAWRMRLEGGGGGRSVAAYVTFVPYRGSTWRIMGVSPARAAEQYLGRTLSTARSFRPLTPEEKNSLTVTRLRLATARPDEDLTELGRRTGSAWDPSHAAVYNGIFVNHRFGGGERVKIAGVTPYVPRSPQPNAP